MIYDFWDQIGLIKGHYQKLRKRLNYLEHLTDACKRIRENRQQVIK